MLQKEMNHKQALPFRPRVPDWSKPIPIHREDEDPSLANLARVTRLVTGIPTGMEKTEENELHLLKAIDNGQAIPVPSVEGASYELSPYQMPRNLIQTQPMPFDEDTPQYDADSEDEHFAKCNEIDLTRFEKMIESFETNSSRKVLTLDEAKCMFPDDPVITTSVYEYWLEKRLRIKQPLMPIVPTEPSAAKNQAYVAFRKRLNKRVTRRNRRTDENSYKKILQLRADLQKVLQILELVRRRETAKRDLIKTEIDILKSRYRAGDFDNNLYNSILREKVMSPNRYKVKKNYVKVGKKPKAETASTKKAEVVDDEENNAFAFRRKLGCFYFPPTTNLCEPITEPDIFVPTTLDGRNLAFARRRLGRGGRVLIDRKFPPYPYIIDPAILREIQREACSNEFVPSWHVALDCDGEETINCDVDVPECFEEMKEEKEVIHIRGKKSFTDYLNEIKDQNSRHESYSFFEVI